MLRIIHDEGCTEARLADLLLICIEDLEQVPTQLLGLAALAAGLTGPGEKTVLLAMPDQAVLYLPQDRRLALARQSVLPERIHGAALFTDIAGFPPLTEGLVRLKNPASSKVVLLR